MAFEARGQVDFAEGAFTARFDYDLAIVARIKQIQRRHWNGDRAVWIIAPHWPSVRRLLNIASELGWEITARAREAEQRVKEDSEVLEYSVDVVHDSHGEAWFQCKVADDDLLARQMKALPGAYWEDFWWIPTDWERCCGPLLELVQSDVRLREAVSESAWRLLEEPDVADQFVRSAAPPAVLAVNTEDAEPLAAGTVRKPRVSARTKRPATPADEDATRRGTSKAP